MVVLIDVHTKLLVMLDPQILQTAINASKNSHTQMHQIIDKLKNGSVIEAKQLLSKQIAILANILMIL